MTSQTQIAQITRRAWDSLPADAKVGAPEAGDARVRRHSKDRGPVLVPVRVVNATQLFQLGQIVATPAALAAAHGSDPAIISRMLWRHVNGDWGDLDAEDLDANDQALADGYRLLSAYCSAGVEFWIITEADRSATTVLLPSDY